jgi:hypothetical protein
VPVPGLTATTGYWEGEIYKIRNQRHVRRKKLKGAAEDYTKFDVSVWDIRTLFVIVSPDDSKYIAAPLTMELEVHPLELSKSYKGVYSEINQRGGET